MKLIHITDFFDSNSTRFINQSVNNLNKRGHNVVIYSSKDSIIDANFKIKTRLFTNLKCGNGSRYFPPRSLFFALIPRLLFMKKPDVVHSYVLGSFSSTIASYICALRKIPLIIEADYNVSKKSKLKLLLNLFDKYIPAHLATNLTVFTKEQKQVLCEELNLSQSKVKIFPVPIKIKINKNSKNLPKFKKFTVLHIGNISPAKGFNLFLSVVKALPHINFIHIGSFIDNKYGHKYDLRIRALSNLKFIETLSNKLLLDYYKKSHLFLQTSNYESYGIALMEALSVGLPSISTPVGVAKDLKLVRKGNNCAELVNLILDIKNNYNCNKKLEMGLSEIEKFNLISVIDNLERLYQNAK